MTTKRIWWLGGLAGVVLFLLGAAIGINWNPPWHVFAVSTWGTVGQWTSTLLSAVSIFLVLYVIFRDRLREVRKQASQVFVAVEWKQPAKDPVSGGTVTLTVHNPSEAPIRHVRVEYSPYLDYWPTKVLNQFDHTYTVAEYTQVGYRKVSADGYTYTMNIVPAKSSDVSFYLSIPEWELGVDRHNLKFVDHNVVL